MSDNKLKVLTEKDEMPASLTVEEMKTISNLLFTGKWNLSLQESQQVVTPIINKLAQFIDIANKMQTKE